MFRPRNAMSQSGNHLPVLQSQRMEPQVCCLRHLPPALAVERGYRSFSPGQNSIVTRTPPTNAFFSGTGFAEFGMPAPGLITNCASGWRVNQGASWYE